MIIGLTLGLILTTILFSLPAAISSAYFRQWLENRLAVVLKRPLRIEAIDWKWPARIAFHNVTLTDFTPIPETPLITVGDIELSLFPGELPRRRLGAHIVVDGVTLRIRRREDGRTNLDLFFADLTRTQPKKDAEPARDKTSLFPDLKTMVFESPLDIWADFRLTGLNAEIQDQRPEQRLKLDDGELHLDMPDLFSQPIYLRSTGTLTAGGHSWPLRLSLRVENRSALPRTFLPEKTVADAEIRIPGLTFSVNGIPAGKGVDGKMDLDLGEFHQAVRSLLPPSIARTEIAGKMNGDFHSEIMDRRAILFDCGLQVFDLKLTGESFPDSSIGPLQINMRQTGNFDAPTGNLTVDNGEIVFLDRSRIHWKGQIAGIGQEQAHVVLSVAPSVLDLGELYDLFKNLIPHQMAIATGPTGKGPMLKIGVASIIGKMPEGFGGVELNDIDLSIPELMVQQNGNRITVNDTTFSIHALKSVIEDFFPRATILSASLGIGHIAGTGERSLRIDGLTLPVLEVNCTNMQRSGDALLGIETDVTVRQELTIAAASMKPLISVENLTQSLEGRLSLRQRVNTGISIKKLSVAAPIFRIDSPNAMALETDAGIHMSLDRMDIDHTVPFHLDFSGLKTDIELGKQFRMNLTADAQGSGKQEVQSEGRIRLDLAAVSKMLRPYLPEGVNVNGNGTCVFHIAGRIPEPEERARLSFRPGFRLQKDLPFLHAVDISLGLEDVNAGIKPADGETISIGSGSAAPLLHYRYDGSSGQGNAEGCVSIQELGHLPVEMEFQGTVAQFRYDIRHDDLRAVHLNQELSLVPFEIDETGRFALFGLDQLIGSERPLSLPVLLKKIGGELSVTLAVADMKKIPLSSDMLEAAGRFSVETDLQLIPGKSISGRLSLNPEGLDLTMNGTASLTQVRGQVVLDKQYRIRTLQSRKKPDKHAELPPLSALVMEIAGQHRENGPVRQPTNDAEAGGRIMPGPYGSSRNLSFETLRINTPGTPLDVCCFQGQLQLNRGLPEIKPFRLNCLGGTLDGTLAVESRGQDAALIVRLAFSGVNASRFYTTEATDEQDENAEISGQLITEVPIAGDFNRILDEAKLNATITHIGSKALERFLYALDPHGNNESIVSLRQRLRTGMPSWIRMILKDGGLSLDGEILVQGVPLALPDIPPINISALSGMGSIKRELRRLEPIAEILRIAAADTVLPDEREDRITFTNEMQ